MRPVIKLHIKQNDFTFLFQIHKQCLILFILIFQIWCLAPFVRSLITIAFSALPRQDICHGYTLPLWYIYKCNQHHLSSYFLSTANVPGTLSLCHIKVLYIYICILALSPLAQLQTLDLRHNAISSFNPALFSTLTNLTSLRLSNNNLGRAFSDTHLNYAG